MQTVSGTAELMPVQLQHRKNLAFVQEKAWIADTIEDSQYGQAPRSHVILINCHAICFSLTHENCLGLNHSILHRDSARAFQVCTCMASYLGRDTGYDL